MANIDGTPTFDFLQGTLNNDTLRGLSGNDTLQGFGGNDLIFGDRDSDSLVGNEGADSLFGGQGNDTFYGGEGNDIINGDRGQDFLIGGEGRDILAGGIGDDFFAINKSESVSTPADADEITDFGIGNDQIVLAGGLKFNDLSISVADNKTVLTDKITGKRLAVLSQEVNLTESNFISLGGLEMGQALPISTTTNIAGNVLELEVARTPVEQQIGLMSRTELAADRGMLFPIEPPRVVAFWMKNVLIDLDMVFMRDGIVQAIIPNVPPCSSEPCPIYGPGVTVDGVIELRGGRAAELGLKVGDRVF